MHVQPKWFEAGSKEYAIDFLPLLALEFIFMGFFELKRYQGWRNTGSVRASLVLRFAYAASRPSTMRRLHGHNIDRGLASEMLMHERACLV